MIQFPLVFLGERLLDSTGWMNSPAKIVFDFYHDGECFGVPAKPPEAAARQCHAAEERGGNRHVGHYIAFVFHPVVQPVKYHEIMCKSVGSYKDALSRKFIELFGWILRMIKFFALPRVKRLPANIGKMTNPLLYFPCSLFAMTVSKH